MAFNWTLLINYLLCFFFGIMIFLVFMRNYIITWLKVKLPFFSTADIHVRIKNPVRDYFSVGSYNNGMLYYRAKPRPDNNKPERMISISQDVYNRAVYRSNAVSCIDVDDVKNAVLIWDGDSYRAVAGFNAEAMDETVKTALKKPSMDDGLTPKVFQWIVIGGIVILGVGIYLIFKQTQLIDTHAKMIYDLVLPIYNQMNITVVAPATIL